MHPTVWPQHTNVEDRHTGGSREHV